MECKFCTKICKNINSLKNHERLCKLNPNKQLMVSNFIKYNEKKTKGEIKGTNQFIKAETLGLPKPNVSEETKRKISSTNKGRKHSEDFKKLHSERMIKAVTDHPDSYIKNNVVGRVRNVEYNGIVLKGNWELLVAKWLDMFNIKWEYETKYFEYKWNGTRRYYPDFYLPEYDIYLEVKGYESERDLIKWESVPNLVVFKRREIDIIKNVLGL